MYIILSIAGVLVIAFISSTAISWYLGVPLIPISKPVPSPTKTVVKPTSVKKVTLKNGQYFYEIHGQFPTNPYYQNDLLRGEFTIDEDPYTRKVPVVMTAKTGKINVGRSKGGFSGTTVWKLESTEALKSAIKPNKPVQLRIQFLSTALSAHDRLVKKTLDSIIIGDWTIPKDFLFIPVMVGVVE